MVAFSKACLEGRALEDALAGDKGFFVRMYDRHQGKWMQVKAAEAKAASSLLSTRWDKKSGFGILPCTFAPEAWHTMLPNGSGYFETYCSQP